MWKHHLDTMHSLARHEVPAHLRSKLDPEDLVQAAIVKVQKVNDPFVGRTEEEVCAYLRQALVSALAEVIRGFDRTKRRAARERSLEVAKATPADQTSPTARARRNEQMVVLAKALATLPKCQRQAVELHYFQKKSLGETAEIMGITYAAAAGLVRRGLKKLRERLVEPIT